MSITTRFSGIMNNTHKYNYQIFGCGAIGSNVAINLVRMGAISITLYDFDRVAPENIGISSYVLDNIGQLKVDALNKQLLSINPRGAVTIYPIKVDKSMHLQGSNKDIIILSVDSMADRLEIVNAILPINPFALIDTRMGSEAFQMYTFQPLNIRRYKNCWYSDEESTEEPCNMRATTYCSMMASAFVTSTIRKLITKQLYQERVLFSFPSLSLIQNTIRR